MEKLAVEDIVCRNKVTGIYHLAAISSAKDEEMCRIHGTSICWACLMCWMWPSYLV